MSFSKILLVMPSGRHGLGYSLDFIPIGLEYLAAYIEERVSEVNIIDLKMEHRPIDFFFRRFKPDLVGISMCATEHTEGLAIAKKAKQLGIMTAVGNYHPSGLPQYFASHPDIDFVIRGEGEETLLELISKGHAVGVQGVSYMDKDEIIHNSDRPLIKDLDSIPFPARHLRKHKYSTKIDRRIRRGTLTFSRGCSGQCTFCCESYMNKSNQRYRSPDNILKELIEVYELHGRRPLSINITDPDALGNSEIIEKLCDRLIPLKFNLEINCHVRADNVVAYPDVVGKMVKAGFTTFEMGIESPNQRDLSSTRKGMGVSIHKEACQIIREHGAHPLGTFVVGLPEQTEEDILSFPKYGREIGLSKAAFGIATPFPGTEFYEELKKKSLIFEKDWNKFDEMHSVFDSNLLPDKRVEFLASRCMSKFWTIDKLLDIENLDRKRTRKKIPFSEFGKHLDILMEMGRHSLIQIQNNQFLSHVLEFVDAAPDEAIEEKTRALKIHEIFKMDRFLKILGDQIIEITVEFKSQPLTSWILKLKNHRVDCIQVIQGEAAGATVHFRFDLKNYENNPNPSWAREAFIHLKLLQSPKGISGKINTAKLFLALALE